MSIRLFKTLAVFIGVMSHLILDEMWSVDFRRGRYYFKSSFGTALKFWGRERVPNLVAYSIMVFFAVLVYHDEGFMQRFGYREADVPRTAVQVIQNLWDDTQAWLKR